MLSSSNLKSGQADSYFEQDDYYSKEEGPGGSRWLGKGAKKLGLEGGVEKKDFSEVLRGRSPNGELLFSRKIDQSKRRAATDFTFSAPKSVSVAGLVQGDQRVIEAHHLAVERTLAILEERYVETRVMTSTGRKTISTGNLVAAVFAHGTSREAEPQLHSHCVVMNATQVENGRWYSFLNDSAIANKKLLGQIYQNELAIELKSLGYEIEQREHGQFDIKGYSKEILETFSTRRGQIEALIEEWKESGKIVRDANGHPISTERLIYEAATLKTRKAKPQVIEAGKLLQNWKAILAMKGLSLPDIPTERQNQPEAGTSTVSNSAIAQSNDNSDRNQYAAEPNLIREANAGTPLSEKPKKPKKRTILDDAIAHCAERNAVFEPKQIEKFVFENHIGTTSIAALEQDIEEHDELIDLGFNKKDKPIITTESALQLELKTIQVMQTGQRKEYAIVLEDTVNDSFTGSSLSEEQRQAIAASCASTDRTIAWQGSAGAGKTYGLNAFKQLAEAGGYAVSGYAPSSAAAHELGESLKIQTETVARLLISEPIEEEADQKKLWLVDEAGLLSMKNAHELLCKAAEQNARIVLVGDTKQLSAVEAGNPFRSLQAGGMQTFHLDEARRQKKEELRQAVELVAAGKVGESLDLLDASGYISGVPDIGDRIAQVADDFLSLPTDERTKTLMLAGTNKNRIRLTEFIRAGLQENGELGDDAFKMKSLQRKDLTVVQGRYAGRYEEGDVIVPIRDYKKQNLVRNEHYVVRAINRADNTLTVEAPDGDLIEIDPKECDRKSTYKVLVEPIAAGDRLKWTKNNRIEETRNGQQFTVTGISTTGIAQTIDDDGNHREIDLSGYQHIDYAWISTTYSSQGKTAERVLALMDRETINKEAFYVATSRAKNDLHLYTADVGQLRELAGESKANENVGDYLPIYELAQNEQSLSQQTEAAADHARQIAADVGRSLNDRQRAATESSQPEQSESNRSGNSAADYGTEFDGVPQRVKKYARQVERNGQVVRVGEAALAVDHCAEQIQRRASAERQVTDATARLHREIEHATRSRQNRTEHLRPKTRRAVEKPELRDRYDRPSRDAIAPLEPLPQTYPPVELQPPAPEASLAQQLDDFADVLGYKKGDRIYVRALLPKNLSDDLAIRQRLKFKIEENGKKRLIPNTRRGYLTVGSWEFTHIRKNKDPAVHQDGLAKLTELNKEGRGIYFVVNPGGEKDNDVKNAHSVFWENDDKSKAEQIEQARTAGLPLGAVVETNKSIHCYSPLNQPIKDLGQWKQLQERLIQRMESDPAIRNSSRLMRLPGFDHVRVEGESEKEKLVFTPVTLRHIDKTAQASTEAIADKLPQWDKERWTKENKKGRGSGRQGGVAAAPTLATDNPWDIRNFSQYLDGDHFSQNGWLQVKCPHHGTEDGSGTSLGINESTGQYTCHAGCDSKSVYRAAWKKAEERGWQPPKRKNINEQSGTPEPNGNQQPVLVEDRNHKPETPWSKYSVGGSDLEGKQRDLFVAQQALKKLNKQQVIKILMKHSPYARSVYKQKGSTPAYNYVSTIVGTARRYLKHHSSQQKSQDIQQ